MMLFIHGSCGSAEAAECAASLASSPLWRKVLDSHAAALRVQDNQALNYWACWIHGTRWRRPPHAGGATAALVEKELGMAGAGRLRRCGCRGYTTATHSAVLGK
jgi:hypothetical protein